MDMNFDINIPVRILSGDGCIAANPGKLAMGKRAFIVCGGRGARASGALGDVEEILGAAETEYTVFDKITENPPLEICHEGGQAAHTFAADYVIGIGGGSSLDAAKAVAAFAANPDISPTDIFVNGKRRNRSLPLVLIPTTAGTGSEANAYSVLTLPGGRNKKTFTSPDSWAKYAFLDPKYTMSMPHYGTISCALDAFAHGIESYLSPRSTGFSSSLAMFAMKGIWEVLTAYPENFTYEMREALLYASCAAGIAISITGTGFPHPLGYSLTMLAGIPHGAACAIFEGDFIEFNERTEEGARRMSEIYSALSTTSKIMKEYLPALSGVDVKLTGEQIREYVGLVKGAGNYTNSPYVINESEMHEIYERHFLIKGRKAANNA